MSFNARLPHSPAAPVARNPYNYLAWGGQMPATYTGQSPPSNFSDQRVAKASQLVKRPLSAAKQSGYCPEKPPPPEYPLKLNGVAPADRVPVLERGTTPECGVRAFVSTRSNGAILYQSAWKSQSLKDLHQEAQRIPRPTMFEKRFGPPRTSLGTS